jgi:hypothetical protein
MDIGPFNNIAGGPHFRWYDVDRSPCYNVDDSESATTSITRYVMTSITPYDMTWITHHAMTSIIPNLLWCRSLTHYAMMSMTPNLLGCRSLTHYDMMSIIHYAMPWCRSLTHHDMVWYRSLIMLWCRSLVMLDVDQKKVKILFEWFIFIKIIEGIEGSRTRSCMLGKKWRFYLNGLYSELEIGQRISLGIEEQSVGQILG